jgi:uncharacterized protein (DUF2249 family)
VSPTTTPVTVPPHLAGLPADRMVDVDVRDDLRSGREPFARIMAARQGLPPGAVLRVRAIFEPVPLYAIMERQGLAHWTERLAEDDWRVWFHPAPSADAAAPRAPEAAADAETGGGDGVEDGTLVLDVRGLEPPEPMVRTLQALETLAPGGTLVQINDRVPRFLLPEAEARGFIAEVREQAGGPVRVFFRHAAAAAPAAHSTATPRPGAFPMSEATDTPMELDVRVIPPREKHPTIFQTFDALAPGERFILVNDHDPFPLRYQFEAERPGAFSWTYVESGPTVWRVEIART